MIIGICGGTGSGKTTIARRIVESVGAHNVVLVEQDSYYRNLADMPLDERHQANFDHPDSIDSRAAPNARAAPTDSFFMGSSPWKGWGNAARVG